MEEKKKKLPPKRHRLEIRRLLCNKLQPAQNRTYVGVCLNEDNPSPRYVYVDSEIPISDNLPFDKINGQA